MLHPQTSDSRQVQRAPVALALLAGLLPLALAPLGNAAVLPYTPDVGTVYLFHLNESFGASVASNSAPKTSGTNLVSFNGNLFAGDGANQPAINTVLGAAGFGSFGNGADMSGATTIGLGLDVSGNGGFQLDDGAPVSNDRSATHHFFGPGNTFTLEALVNVPSITSGLREIISTDHGSANDARGLQFRITAAGQLEFNFIGVNTGSVFVTIPTSGPHAFAAGQWFHVALTYDGGNARFYWTRLDSGAASANLIGGPVAEGVDASDGMLLVIGNEGRAVSTTGSTEGLAGLIDEVRISSVARASNEFVFQSVVISDYSSYEAGSTNYPENSLDGNLESRWSSQGDGQYVTYDLGRIVNVSQVNLAFYQPGAVRTNWFDVLLSNDNLVWRPALANASGTNSALAAFDFPDWPARYVRYVGHLNSVNNYNSLTEIQILADYATDSDSDGLSDIWELHYFTNLAATTYSDPDGDGQSNESEFLHGTDPTQFTDGGDIDGDALPDAWEAVNLGGLSQGPYDDSDGDSYNNQSEYLAGTLPLVSASVPPWAPPGVAFLRDSVVATNALLMPSATYGRAINGISYQNNNILLTFEGYQYTAWYDTVGTAQFVWLARRTVTNTSVGAWEKFQTGSEFLNGDETAWDAHNVISIGICPADGTLHLAWDHHNHTLKYRRSVAGLCTTNQAAWGPGMLNPQQDWLVSAGQSVADVTYPQFTITPTGGLMFNRRIGSSGNGDQLFHQYLPIAGGTGGNWAAGTLFLSRTGTYNGSPDRNAYINGLDYGQDGKLHVTWTWRETASSANHDICYAYSTNNGVRWFNNAGTLIADTSMGQSINLNSPGIIIKPLDVNQLIINQQAQCVDNDGYVHALMLHRRDEPGYAYPNYTTAAYSTLATAYHHYFRDPGTGAWLQRRLPVDAWPVGSRPKIGFDASGNVYAVYLSYPAGTAVTPGYTSGTLVVASASRQSQYTDWRVAQALTVAFSGEPLLDQSRLLVDNILSVYVQEHSATVSVVGTLLHAFDFAVRVLPPSPMSLQFFGPDSVVTIPTTNTLSYQLQYTPALAPAAWTNAGPATTGVNGLLSLPDANGRLTGQRFYRVLQSP